MTNGSERGHRGMAMPRGSIRASYARPAGQSAGRAKRPLRQHLDAEDLRNLARVLATVASLASRIGKVSARLAKIEQELSDLGDETTLLTERLRALMADMSTKYPDLELAQALEVLPPASAKRKKAKRDNKAEQAKREAAKGGVEKLIIRRDHDDWAQITMAAPEEVAFRLPPRLVDLLVALAQPGGESADALIGFKPRTLLGKSLGNASEGSVVNLVSRLRQKFRKAGANDMLIQTNDASYRLASQQDALVYLRPSDRMG